MDQNTPVINTAQLRFLTLNTTRNVNYYTAGVLNEANMILESTFSPLDIDTCLEENVNDGGFTVAIAIKEEKVVGVMMYVFMNKYVWADDIAVKRDMHSKGIGSQMIQWIKKVAELRRKDILVYAIEGAIAFYIKCGFVEIERYSVKYQMFKGKYMTWQSPYVIS